MRGERFFDTNILICAFAAGDHRTARAEALLAEGGAIGVQVLNQFTHVVRRKPGWDWPQVDAALSVIAELLEPARPLTADKHAHAVKLARTSALPFYDAVIVTAAADAGCRALLTEDMQHGRKFGGVTIHDPFVDQDATRTVELARRPASPREGRAGSDRRGAEHVRQGQCVRQSADGARGAALAYDVRPVGALAGFSPARSSASPAFR